jgi:hypothetical protein
MTVGELVFANVVDQRVWDVDGERGQTGIYLGGSPGRALPFTVYRAWKVGTGMVTEEIRFIGPSGRTVYRWGPVPRRMRGSMDLTVETDRIDDARFEQTGIHVVSFVVDDEIVSELEVPVYVQLAPQKLSKDVEDGLKRSDVIFVGVDNGSRRGMIPSWFVYRNGKIYVLSKLEPGPEEQTIPGIPGASEVLIVTRRKENNPEIRGRDASLERFPAAVRTLEGAEWEEAATLLADRRRSRNGPPQDSIARWRGTCAIAELVPVVPG